jgi:hypothetical protein
MELSDSDQNREKDLTEYASIIPIRHLRILGHKPRVDIWLLPQRCLEMQLNRLPEMYDRMRYRSCNSHEGKAVRDGERRPMRVQMSTEDEEMKKYATYVIYMGL